MRDIVRRFGAGDARSAGGGQRAASWRSVVFCARRTFTRSTAYARFPLPSIMGVMHGSPPFLSPVSKTSVKRSVWHGPAVTWMCTLL